jgi:putative aldouronate transport system permease protein
MEGSKAGAGKLRKELYNARYLYLLILPTVAYFVVFRYLPMAGVLLAFKEFRANLGILRSPWVGFRNYEFVFRDPVFARAIKNTFIISFGRIVFQFPVPILLALMLNEVRSRLLARPLQTVFTFPHFLSWVVVGGIMVNFLGDQGALNNLLVVLGIGKVSLLSNERLFRPLLYVTQIWKGAGWSCIIYLAAIAAINPELYEAAIIDGAGRVRRMVSITVPCIRGTIVVLFVLSVGNVMTMGFDQVFNMQNPAVMDVSEILGTYIYHVSFAGPMDFGFSTAMGLFTSLINFVFLIGADRIAKLLGESGLFVR